jgi:hypothetical protein
MTSAREPALLAWNLSCSASPCFALGAGGGSPAPVVAQPEPDGTPAELANVERDASDRLPALGALESLATTEPLSDVDAVTTDAGELVASVTYFDPAIPYERPTKPAPDGRFAPVRAQLKTQLFTQKGAEPAHIVSYRARSLGGVALAARSGTEALLVWTALDAGNPQVFATLLDARGNKQRQRMITRSAGETSDVTAVRVDDGWVLAWVDERDADPEVYATKLDDQLNTRVAEQRITRSAGAATGVEALLRNESVWLVWADARDAEQPGFADVYMAELAAADLGVTSPPKALATTPPHSHSPRLAAHGDGAAIAWIEAGSSDTEPSNGARLLLAELDARGRFVGPPEDLNLEGDPTAVAIDCGTRRCRGLAATQIGQSAVLWGFVWTASGAPLVSRLCGVTAPAAALIGPVWAGDAAFFSDGSASPARLRRLRGRVGDAPE